MGAIQPWNGNSNPPLEIIEGHATDITPPNDKSLGFKLKEIHSFDNVFDGIDDSEEEKDFTFEQICYLMRTIELLRKEYEEKGGATNVSTFDIQKSTHSQQPRSQKEETTNALVLSALQNLIIRTAIVKSPITDLGHEPIEEVFRRISESVRGYTTGLSKSGINEENGGEFYRSLVDRRTIKLASSISNQLSQILLESIPNPKFSERATVDRFFDEILRPMFSDYKQDRIKILEKLRIFAKQTYVNDIINQSAIVKILVLTGIYDLPEAKKIVDNKYNRI